MKPKTFMLTSNEIAAEQRAIVAHSASYGVGRPQIFPAPAGAEENHLDSPKILSPHPGLEFILGLYSHISRCGLLLFATPWLKK